DVGAVLTYADALVSAGSFEEALQVFEQHCERLLAADPGKVLQTLHSLIGHVRENPADLEKLLSILQKAGDTTHVTEIYELLAHASVQSGELEKARDYYLKLTQLEPENQIHARNYQQVLGKLGGSGGGEHLITAEEGAILVDELEATAPFIDQRYSDDVALAIRAALTDAELFISYNMPAKALAPLLSALPQAPRDLRMNQKLAALHTRAGRFTEAAVCCRTLEGIYHEAGNADEASRYGNLAEKYEQRAGSSPVAEPEVNAVTPASVPGKTDVAPLVDVAPQAEVPEFPTAVASAEVVAPAPDTAEFSVHAEPLAPAEEEIDISAEWEGAVVNEPPSAGAEESTVAASAEVEQTKDNGAAVDEAIEEIRFYLASGMTEEAQAGFRNLRRLQPEASKLETIRREIEAAMSKAPAAEPAEAVSVDEVQEAEVEIPKAEVEAAADGANELGAMASEVESSLGEGFLPQTTAKEVPSAPSAQLHAEPNLEPANPLNEFVSDLEASLGDGFLAEAPVAGPDKEMPTVAAHREATPVAVAPAAMAASAAHASAGAPSLVGNSGFTYQPKPIRPAAPAAPSMSPDPGAQVDLAGMFGDLKQELEEDSSSTDEDPETHYNLGVAFREMGLLDEAIAELQKVCQAADRGQQLPQIMQTYTWLAQCFLDKGVPEAAIRWYEKALKLPNLDLETRTALHYELGSSYETAGSKNDALQHFMEVYGNNIDYRDVAERVKALKS
ncbi:MAG: hypothetical protein JOZ80_12600, partial [Acidobacteriaceae bacterium]|nr:hypothetical protein [Acidobacteriaceae bacterium]